MIIPIPGSCSLQRRPHRLRVPCGRPCRLAVFPDL